MVSADHRRYMQDTGSPFNFRFYTQKCVCLYDCCWHIDDGAILDTQALPFQRVQERE